MWQVFLFSPQKESFSAKAKSGVKCSYCIPATCVTYPASGQLVTSALCFSGGGGSEETLMFVFEERSEPTLPTVWTVTLSTRNEEPPLAGNRAKNGCPS